METAIFFGVNIRYLFNLQPETFNLIPHFGVKTFFNIRSTLISLLQLTAKMALGESHIWTLDIPCWILIIEIVLW